MIKRNQTNKERRIYRVRRKILENPKAPRLSIFRSNRFITAQIIDDKTKKTIVAVSENELKNVKTKLTKTQRSKETGLLLAQRAKAKKIKQVVFDRGPYQFHGRVRAFADGAREGGLQF